MGTRVALQAGVNRDRLIDPPPIRMPEMPALQRLLFRLASAVFLPVTAAGVHAQAPEVSIRYESGGTIANGTLLTGSAQMNVVFQVCTPNQLTSLVANHDWITSSTSLTLQDGPSNDCSSGGAAWIAEVTLRPGTNRFEIDATDEYFANSFTSVTVQYVPPFRASVESPAPGGLRIPRSYTHTLPVTVTNNGSAANAFTVSVSCGAPLSSCGPSSFSTSTLQPGASAVHELTVTAGTTSGSTTLTVIAASDYPDTAVAPMTVTGASVLAPEATRARDTLFVSPSSARSALFQVRNPDPFATRALTFAVNACGTNTSCSVTPASVTLGPGADTTVALAFTTPATNQTTLVVLSSSASGPTQSQLDTTRIKVGSAGTPTVSVNVADYNPGTSVARDQCLSIAAGAAAGIECGALRVAHGLPGVRTMGVARAPTLLFLSDHGNPRVRITAKVSVANLVTPDSLRATLSVPGIANLTRNWGWNPECGSATGCIITFPIETAGLLATGKHDFTLEVRIGSGSPPTGSATGSFVVVDTKDSFFGRGWWLEGHERLLFTPDTTQRLWIGGDGSTRLYIKRNTTTWTVDAKVTRADTLVWSASDGLYLRRLRNGGYVGFDALGRHRRTVNRQGHTTLFEYRNATSPRLASIELPIPSGSTAQPTFYFDYSSDTSRVVRVRARGLLATKIDTTFLENDANGRLERVIGQARDTVRFLYATPTTVGVLTGRVNRLNDTTVYHFNAHGTVDSVRIKMRTAAAIVTRFCAAETRALVACGSLAGGALPLSRFHSRLDGARSDVVDQTSFYINRFGAPDTVVDATGARTRLKRANTSFPALVTEMTDVAGLVSESFYNARGLPDSTRVLNPYATGANAVSRIKWHAKWDMATSMRSPTNEADSIWIDSTTGNRMWQFRGSDATKVRYTYDGHNRVDSIITQAIGLVGRVEYESALGNVWKSRSAMGFVTEALQDARGVDSLVWTPTDSAQTSAARTKQIVRFDAAGRPVRTETHAPSIAWSLYPMAPDSATAPAAIQVVVNEYDKEGQTLSVRRFAATDSSSGATAKSIMTYDAAGRVITKTEWHSGGTDVMTYDPAGNLVSTTTRRGYVLKQAYDELNRLIARTTPKVEYGRTFCSECHSWSEFIVGNDSVFAPDYGSQVAPNLYSKSQIFPAELTLFGFDDAGRMVQADNPDVQIRRGYFPNGALKSDTTTMRAYDLAAIAPWPTANRSILGYTYDLSGRRLTRTDHRGGLQTYAYDSLGQLTATADRPTSTGDTVTVTFGYDALGRLTSQSIPDASASASWAYDVEGRVTSRTEEGFSDTFRYDARGKRIEVTGKLHMTDAAAGGFRAAYDGIGQLIASSTDDRPVPTSDRTTADAHGNTKVRWSNRGGWGGNTESLDSATFLGHRLEKRVGSHFPEGRTGPGGVGPAIFEVDSLAITYDNSGNVGSQMSIRRQFVGNYGSGHTIRGKLGHSWSWNFYDASERLRAAQRSAPPDTSGKISTIFEEYWYDALGRRVLVRTRVDSTTACPATEVITPVRCQQQILRTTWDGDQVLFEQRDPAGYQYTSAVPNAGERGPLSGGDAWFGHVRYTQTGAIDNPLVVWKNNGTPRVLHRNWRGNVAGATFASGGGAGMPDTTTVWPAAMSDVWHAPDARQALPTPNAWLGSLVADGKDGTGTLYRRNRYYDPTSGRFTQEDPIGLAGGLNLYGYGDGDPVNNSDPFGLSKCPPNCFGGGGGFGGHGSSGSFGGPPSFVEKVVEAATEFVNSEAGLALSSAMIEWGMSGTPSGASHIVPYRRPAHATTPAQRAAVQGQACVRCGTSADKMIAGHKKALVQEHYETGSIDKTKMRSVEAVQPECTTCSAREGAEMSRYSREQKAKLEKP